MKNFLNLHNFSVTVLTFAFMASTYAATQPPITEYQLSNNLKLIVKEDHRAPVVFSSIWYKVGGSYEPSGITGISHALEHMMFRGTHQYGPGKLAELINANGGDQNAMTSDDFTVYFQTLPAEKLELSFTLESDRMKNLSLDENAFTKEIQVVMEERRMRTEDDPQALTMERFNAVAYINNPYSRPVVGWMSDLQQMHIQDLRNWYHQWYVPNNAVIVVIGDVQPQQVYALAKKYFEALPAQPIIEPKPTTEVSALGLRRINVQIPAKLPMLLLGYNTPSLHKNSNNTQDPYILTVLAYLMGGGDSSRLNRNLVRGQQIAASISASYDLYNLHSNLFLLSAVPAKKTSLTLLEQQIQKAVEQFKTALVTLEELQRAKALIIAQHVYDQDSLMSQAFNLAMPEMNGLSWRQEQEFIAHIEAVTAEQIQAAAKQYLVTSQLTIGRLEPIGETHETSPST